MPAKPSPHSAKKGRRRSRDASQPCAPLSEQLAPDDLTHDFRGAPGNAPNARIDVGPRNGIFEHVAVAAEELQALVDDLALQFSAQQLGRGRIRGS
jgi:hypothetical protein